MPVPTDRRRRHVVLRWRQRRSQRPRRGRHAGFAINGGKGWSECIYDNHQVEIKNGVGIAMGNYYFTSAEDSSKTKVEYTFGYTRCDDGKVRIFLHHSSVPYK